MNIATGLTIWSITGGDIPTATDGAGHESRLEPTEPRPQPRPSRSPFPLGRSQDEERHDTADGVESYWRWPD